MRLIICQDEVLVLSVPDREHPSQPAFPAPDDPFVRDLVQRVSQQGLTFASDHNLHVDTSLPFELRALEAVLTRGRQPSTTTTSSIQLHTGNHARRLCLLEVDIHSCKTLKMRYEIHSNRRLMLIQHCSTSPTA